MFSIIDDNFYYLQVAFEANPLGIAILDSKSRFLHVNPAFCQMLGYIPEEFSHFTIQDITHPQDRQPSEWLTASAGEEEIKPHWFEKRYVTKEGKIIWVSIMARVLKDSFGQMHLGMVIVEDITQRKLQEEQLRQSEQRFQSLVEAIPDMIILARKDGWILDVKPALEVQSWLKPQQYVHHYFSELPVPKNIKGQIMDAFREAFEKKQPQEVEYQLDFPDEVRDYEARLVAMNDEQGFAIIRDVTQRKKMERELKHRDILLESINKVATRFLNPLDWDLAMQEVLHILTEALEAHCGLMFKHAVSKSGSYASLLYEWVQPEYSSVFHHSTMHKYSYQNFTNGLSQASSVLEKLLKKESVKGFWAETDETHQQEPGEKNSKNIIIIPIFVDEDLWGIMGFEVCDDKHIWSGTEEDVLHIAADIIGVAIQRKQTEEALLYSEELYRGVINTSPDAILFTDMDGSIILANQQAASLVGLQRAGELMGKNITDIISHEERDRFFLHIYTSSDDEAIRDYECLVTRQPGLRFPAEFSAMLIKNKQGAKTGTIIIFRDITERKMTESALTSTVDQLRSYVDILKHRSFVLNLVNEFIGKLQNCNNFNEIFLYCEDYFNRIFPDQVGVLYHLNQTSRKYEMAARWGGDHHHPSYITAKTCFAIKQGHTLLTSDDYQEKHCPCGNNPPYICVPLTNHNEVIGVFYLQDVSDRPSETWKLQVINTIIENLSLTITNLTLRKKLHYQSTHDLLTALYNRPYLEEAFHREISKARRYHHSLSLILIDVDDFKTYNDLYGNKAGDIILKSFGKFLLPHMRTVDIPCRYGGDEIVIIAPELSSEDSFKLAEQLQSAARSLSIKSKEVQVEGISLSISIASFPQHGDTLEALFKAADKAMHFSKKHGKGQISLAAEKEE